MKLYLTPYFAAIAASTLAVNNRADASLAHSSFALGHKAFFGLSAQNVFNKIPRGGAQEETEAEVSEEPQVLYLPGLLEASIVKNAQVRFICCYIYALLLPCLLLYCLGVRLALASL
jgi:hypothetical protein